MTSTPSALCSASFLISLATTANPLPDCPARAASMDAFNASRLVCPVISIIRLTASLIDRIAWFVSSIWFVIRSIISADWFELSSTVSMDLVAVLFALPICSEFALNTCTSLSISVIAFPISMDFALTSCTLSASVTAVTDNSSIAWLICPAPSLLKSARSFREDVSCCRFTTWSFTLVTILFSFSLRIFEESINVSISAIAEDPSTSSEILPFAIRSICAVVFASDFRIFNARKIRTPRYRIPIATEISNNVRTSPFFAALTVAVFSPANPIPITSPASEYTGV